MVHDLGKCAEVVWGLAKVRRATSMGGIPYRLHRSEKRGLAGAVLADEERQGGEARGLRFPEATEVPQAYLPELTVAHDRPPHPVSGQRYTSPIGSTRLARTS